MPGTSAKTRRRPPADLWFLTVALEAQDFKCFCCGRAITLESCQRGHIDKRNLDGSNDGPENIAPICESCNRQHAKSEITPHDHLVPDYFQALRILLMARIPGKISCKVMEPSRKVILTTQADENTHFIDLENSEFDPRIEVYARSRKVTPDEAKKVVDDFVAEAMRRDEAIPAPDEMAQRLMMSRVLDTSAEAFLRVGNRVMRLERWRTADRRIDLFFWKREIVDNFFRHEREVRREQREREEQRLREERLAAQHKAEERERRWKQFLLAAQCTPWPNMDAADLGFIAAVTAAKASPVRDVSNEELQRASTVVRQEFLAKREQCVKFLDACDETSDVVGDEPPTGFLRELLQEAQTVKQVESIHQRIDCLYSELKNELRRGVRPDHVRREDWPPGAEDF